MTHDMKWKWTGVLIALVVLIADQLSKWAVVTRFLTDAVPVNLFDWLIQKGEQVYYPSVVLTPFLNMVMVWNRGVSFGMLQSDQKLVSYGLTLMALAVSAGFLIWLWREPKPWRAFAIGMIVGGALGNIWDRLRFGAVADFIDVHVAGYHWPAFNVADAAISIGVVLIVIETFFFSEKPLSKRSHP